MTSTSIARDGREAVPRWAPRAIVCGVDGSRGSAEAVRQAVALAGRESHLDLVLAEWASGHGPTSMAAVGRKRGALALAEARQAAGAAGVVAETRVAASTDPAETLVALAADADLLVVGTSPPLTAAGGIVLGRVATAVAHRSPCDVLIARRPPAERAFPLDIVIGFDGTPSAKRAVAIAAALARRYGSRVTIATFGPSSAAIRHALSEATVLITEISGREPVVVSGDGDAHERIVQLAEALGASLAVLGSRGLSGPRALGSVSERVAHAAPCSVLIARGGVER